MGYWPSVRSRWLDIGQNLFWCVSGPRRSRSPLTRKERTQPRYSHLDQTNMVNKGFIIWLSEQFFLRDTAGRPERSRWYHLARSGGQSQRAIWVILPARGASHIIIVVSAIVLSKIICFNSENANFVMYNILSKEVVWQSAVTGSNVLKKRNRHFCLQNRERGGLWGWG